MKSCSGGLSRLRLDGLEDTFESHGIRRVSGCYITTAYLVSLVWQCASSTILVLRQPVFFNTEWLDADSRVASRECWCQNLNQRIVHMVKDQWFSLDSGRVVSMVLAFERIGKCDCCSDAGLIIGCHLLGTCNFTWLDSHACTSLV